MAKDGVWKTWNGIRLRIASTTQAAWQAAHRRIVARDRQAFAQMDMAEQMRLLAPAIVEHLLTDWADIEENGHPVQFSKAKALEYLSDGSLVDLLIFVFNAALDNEEYRARARKEAVGN